MIRRRPLGILYNPYPGSCVRHHNPLTMVRQAGPAWKHFDMTHKDKHGNKTVCCKGCSKIFKGSHTRMVAHFNPDDASVETCPAATAEVLDEMSKYIHELETKAEAAKKQR